MRLKYKISLAAAVAMILLSVGVAGAADPVDSIFASAVDDYSLTYIDASDPMIAQLVFFGSVATGKTWNNLTTDGNGDRVQVVLAVNCQGLQNGTDYKCSSSQGGTDEYVLFSYCMQHPSFASRFFCYVATSDLPLIFEDPAKEAAAKGSQKRDMVNNDYVSVAFIQAANGLPTKSPALNTKAKGPFFKTKTLLASVKNTDGDQFPDKFDNCTGKANDDQVDADGDGCGDVCDTAPSDSKKGCSSSGGGYQLGQLGSGFSKIGDSGGTWIKPGWQFDPGTGDNTDPGSGTQTDPNDNTSDDTSKNDDSTSTDLDSSDSGTSASWGGGNNLGTGVGLGDDSGFNSLFGNNESSNVSSVGEGSAGCSINPVASSVSSSAIFAALALLAFIRRRAG